MGRGTLHLAWRHFRHYRGRSVLLIASLVLVFLLPVSVKLVVDDFASSLAARAASTPLVVGAKGSRYDLVLSSLYFRGRIPESLSMRTVTEMLDGGLADPIPLHLGHTAEGRPIVGTSHDYYGFRGLRFSSGTAPAFLGDAVLGAHVAQELGLSPGDTLLSDQGSVYELSLNYPLQMRVVGVLDEHGSADDGAVFCDVKTAWVLDGLGHGHVKAALEDDERVLARTEQGVVLGAATFQYTEIEEDNLASFHFHGDLDEAPLQAVLCLPKDEKSATILKGRFGVDEVEQMLVPTDVIDELLGIVFRIRRFFDANTLLVMLAMGLLFGLILLLSLRLRARELDTLRQIGFARATIVRLVAAEWALLLGIALVCVFLASTLLAVLLARFGQDLFLGGGGA